jgi:hypothetical protein
LLFLLLLLLGSSESQQRCCSQCDECREAHLVVVKVLLASLAWDVKVSVCVCKEGRERDNIQQGQKTVPRGTKGWLRTVVLISISIPDVKRCLLQSMSRQLLC